MKAFFLVAVLALLGPGQAMVQDTPDVERFFPRRGFMLSGSGTAGYNAVFADGTLPNNFSAIFAPIVLYQISDRFLFEREFEYKFEGGVTATALETSEVVPLLSVELVSFEARVDGPDVLLSWATASETINAGFEIQWRSKNAGADEQMAQEWQVAGWVDGHGTTERPRSYTYRVTGLAPGRHVFCLKQINFDDTFAYSPEVEAVVKMVERFGYVGHIRRIGEEKLDEQGEKTHPARRWVVERTLSWLSKCRGLLVRYEKKAKNYLGMLQLACGLLWFRRLFRLNHVLR